MNNHPPLEQLEQYFGHTLPSALFLQIHRHVSSCAHCSEQQLARPSLKEEYDILLSAVTAEPEGEPYHLSEAGARIYLGGRMSEIDSEIAEGHLELCEACAARVERLRENKSLSRLNESGALLPGESERQESAGRQRSHILAFATRRWRPLQITALVILAFFIAFALLSLRNRKPDGEEPEAAAGRIIPQNSPGSIAFQPGQGANEAEEKSEPTDAAATAPDPRPQRPPRETGLLNVVEINDGGQRVTVDVRGRLSGLEKLPPHLRQTIKAALTSQTLGMPAHLRELKDKAGTLMGDAKDGRPFKLLNPIGKVVQSERPLFSWQPLAGAQSYVVTITDSQLNEVTESGPLTSTEWQIPGPLARAKTYSWQVTARKGEQNIISPSFPAPQARFRILDQTRNEELQRARRAYAGSHLTLGILYARSGLLDEAEQEFRILMRDNPRSSQVLKLLRSIEGWKE